MTKISLLGNNHFQGGLFIFHFCHSNLLLSNNIKNFENMIDEKEYDDTILKSACAYNEIYKQNNRKNCAFLPYRARKEVLDKYSN